VIKSASLIQLSESHNPSEITLICLYDAQETCMIIINVENRCKIFFCGNGDQFFSRF